MFRSRRYRVDNEQLVLILTIGLVGAVIVLSSTVTFCVSGLFILGMFVISALMIRSHHRSLMRNALPVDELRTPELTQLTDECELKLQPGPVSTYVVDKNVMNAYTFGIGNPKALVLYAPLMQVMTPGELQFIIGHEMGHVALGHTWLNTIVGGLAGIPAPFGAAVILYAAFRWWNRMCEFSADRAGLLACGDLNLAVSALVKLAAPEIRSQQDFDRALAVLDAQDDAVSNRIAEAFQSHPMLIRRINRLRDYTRTAEYGRMQTGVNRNAEDDRPVQVASAPPMAEAPVASPPEPSMPEPPDRPPEERWPWLKKQE
ncbi:M48 family metallopeptidase [bacterium]|nr:M48 family metallopeptidase [bacterium]